MTGSNPRPGARGTTLSRLLSRQNALIGVGLMAFGAPGTALAQCASASGAWICSGTATTTQTITSAPGAAALQATIDSTFQGTGTPDGIDITNNTSGAGVVSSAGTVAGTSDYGVSFDNGGLSTSLTLTETAGSITGATTGISVINVGTGATSISTAGSVIGTGSAGISAMNALTATDLTVTQTAGSVSGFYSGIYALNNGTGATSVATAGSVTATGSNSSGVVVENVASGTSLTIAQTAGSISGGGFGIYAINNGTGATSITTAGTVTGTGLDSGGIVAFNGGNSLTVTETAGSISGTEAGIYVINDGTGATSIATAGTVSATGSGGYGIYAANAGTATDLTMAQTAGSLSGGELGIYAVNSGTGATSISTAGTITGASAGSAGIAAFNRGTSLSLTQTAGSITGVQYGIYAINSGTGATNISTAGTVTGTGAGAVGIAISTQGTDLSLTQSAGSIAGVQDGIEALSNGTGATSITTAGTVIGAGGDGILAVNGRGTSLMVTETAGSISGGAAGIHVGSDGNGTTLVNVAGTVTGGTDAGIDIGGTYGLASAINLGNGANVSAASGVAILDRTGNASVTMASGAKLSGAVLLGAGTNAMTVSGTADLSGVSLLNGEYEEEPGDAMVAVLTPAGGGAEAAPTAKFTFLDTTQSLAGAILRNWNTVTLQNATVTLTDGTLVTGSGINSDSSPQGLVLTDHSTLASPAVLAITGDVAIDPTSALWHALGGTITGNVTNAGLIYWGHLGQTLTINGNYTGLAGSVLSLEAALNGAASTADTLHVTGNATGTTALIVRVVSGSTGASAADGVSLVQVDGTASVGSFVLGSTVAAGAYQFLLQSASNGSGSVWSLARGQLGAVPLYRASAAGYVSAQAVNAEQGYRAISTFHQRVGDQSVTDASGRQTWVSPYYDGLAGEGSRRFGYTDGQIWGVRAGQEIWIGHSDAGTTSRVAFTVDYSQERANFNDRLRPMFGLGAKTGSLKADALSLGATYTRMDASGAYLDLTGQAALLRNKFIATDILGQTYQNGERGALSAEIGKPLDVFGGLRIEPQGQLVYLHTEYDDFSDSVSSISGYGANALRGRIGARISHADLPALTGGLQLAGVVDVLHDFIKPTSVEIGGTPVSDDDTRTWADVGLEAQYSLPALGNAHLYGNALYTRALDNGKTYGYTAGAGLKLAF